MVGRLSFLGIVSVDLTEVQHLYNFVDDTSRMIGLKKLVGADNPENSLALVVLFEGRHLPPPAFRIASGGQQRNENIAPLRRGRQRHVSGQPQLVLHTRSFNLFGVETHSSL